MTFQVPRKAVASSCRSYCFLHEVPLNLSPVKWVRITVYAIRERSWGNFAGFSCFSVPGEQICHISKLFLYEFNNSVKSQKQQQHKTVRSLHGSVLVWSFYGHGQSKLNSCADCLLPLCRQTFVVVDDISLLPWPQAQQFDCAMLSEQEALRALHRSLWSSLGFL